MIVLTVVEIYDDDFVLYYLLLLLLKIMLICSYLIFLAVGVLDLDVFFVI